MLLNWPEIALCFLLHYSSIVFIPCQLPCQLGQWITATSDKLLYGYSYIIAISGHGTKAHSGSAEYIIM